MCCFDQDCKCFSEQRIPKCFCIKEKQDRLFLVCLLILSACLQSSKQLQRTGHAQICESLGQSLKRRYKKQASWRSVCQICIYLAKEKDSFIQRLVPPELLTASSPQKSKRQEDTAIWANLHSELLEKRGLVIQMPRLHNLSPQFATISLVNKEKLQKDPLLSFFYTEFLWELL